MSYRDPGDSYIPPPPPKLKRSPWMFVGIGCGALVFLLVAVIGILAVQIVQENRNHPLNAAKNRIAMGDTPVYPGSELDETMTQAQYAGLKVGRLFGGNLKADSVVTETRLTTESAEEVHEYYWKIMTSRGFKSLPQPEILGSRVVLYRKGNDALLVQVQAVPKLGGNAIVLMRFTNLQDDIGEDVEEPMPVRVESTEISPGKVEQKVITTPAKEKDAAAKGGKQGD